MIICKTIVFYFKNYYILCRRFIYYYKVKVMEYKNKLYINGEWLDGANKETFDVINPATEEVIASVSSAEIEDAKKAIDAAEVAFESWSKVSPRDKSVVLRKAYELFM